MPGHTHLFSLFTAAVGLIALLSGCGSEQPSTKSSGANSVLESASSSPSLFSEALQATYTASLGGEADDLVATLDKETPQALLAALSGLPHLPGDEGNKGGLAAVTLSVLAGKSPVDAVRYLTSLDADYGLHQSDTGLLALRQAMENWASQDADAAFARLEKLRATPEGREWLERLATNHGERLLLTMTGAMPIDALDTLATRWTQLTPNEVGIVLPRHAAKLQSPVQREQFVDTVAGWVSAQWRDDGAEAVFEWAVGLRDDTLRTEVLDRVKRPEGADQPPSE